MLPVEDQCLQNREECGAPGGHFRKNPLARISFQDDFVTNGRVVIIVLFYYIGAATAL